VTRTLPSVMKEARALFPTWLACVVAISARAVVDATGFKGPVASLGSLGLLAYVFGSLALGAQSIGHEYSYRTLGILLAQPSNRRRLLLTKLGVVAAMLLMLNAVMWNVPSNQTDPNRAWSWYGPELLFLSALFVAPWLTMLCRSSLAGIVFTGALLWLLWGMSAVFLIVKEGLNSRTGANSLVLAVWMMFGVCAFAAIAAWRKFMRLEAIEGRGAELTLPRWLRGRTESTSHAQTESSRRQRPVWMLVKKELHLQQMTFVVAALYILCWATAALMERFVPDFPVDFPLLPVTVLYFALLSLVIGSLASAEERQFGTLEWQVLLPMPMWRQWMLKVAVVIGLALVLGVALPIALSYVHVSEDVRVQGAPLWHDKAFVVHMTTIVVLLTTCGLYLSSLSTTGVHALVLSIPVAFAGAAFLPYAVAWAARMAYGSIWDSSGRRLGGPLYYRVPFAFVGDYLWLAVAFGLVALLLRFALQNHRSAERSVARISRHGIWIAGYLTLAVLLLTGVETFMRTRFY
jgi:hypothetical protein